MYRMSQNSMTLAKVMGRRGGNS